MEATQYDIAFFSSSGQGSSFQGSVFEVTGTLPTGIVQKNDEKQWKTIAFFDFWFVTFRAPF